MADVTGSIGNQPVELDNIATERTLRELLASVNRLNGTLLNRTAPAGSGSSSSGGGGSGVANSPAQTISNLALSMLNVPLTIIRGSFTLLSSVVSGLTTAVGAAAGVITNLGQQAFNSTLTLSSFYDSIQNVVGQIPLLGSVLGPLTGLFSSIARVQERNLEVYQKLTDIGVNFGGSLMNMRVAAQNAYMTLDQFSAFTAKHAETFTKLGSSVNKGAEVFGTLSNTLIKSPIGGQLLALGYTTEQLNEGMAAYIDITGYRGNVEAKNTKELAASAAEYLVQLDGLARLTGESRKEQENQMKAATKNAAWQAYLNTLSADEQKKAVAGLANSLAVGGKGAADAFQSRIMGIAPDEVGQKYIALGGNAAAMVEQSADMVKDSSKSIADMNKSAAAALKASQAEFGKYSKETAYAIIRQGGPLADTFQKLGLTSERFSKMSEEEIMAAFKKAEVEGTTAEAVTRANRSLSEFGQQITGAVAPIFEALTKVMAPLVEQFANWVNTIDMEKFAKDAADLIDKYWPLVVTALKDFGTMVLDFSKNMLTDEGRNKIIEDLREGFRNIMKEVAKSLGITVQNQQERQTSLTQDQANWEKMDFSEKVQSSFGRGIEKVGGIFSDTLREQAEGSRIRAETEYLKNRVPGRATGSLGMTGKLFENWGSGSIAMLHGLEAVVTPDQMADIVSNAAAGAARAVDTAASGGNMSDIIAAMAGSPAPSTENIEKLTAVNTQMLTVMKEMSALMKKNVDAVQGLSGNLFA